MAQRIHTSVLVAALGAVLALGALLGPRSPGMVVASVKAPPPTVLVPWAERAPEHQGTVARFVSTNPPLAVPAGTPACQRGQLESLALPTVDLAGNATVPILFRDDSSAACALDGYPAVQVLGPGGSFLARAAGLSARTIETSFEMWPPGPVLLDPGTPPLAPGQPGGTIGVPGQALLDISWYDCREPAASSLLVDLPARGGRVLVAFPVSATTPQNCGPYVPPPSLSRGAFQPLGAAPPTFVSVDMSASLQAPPIVRRGASLVYQVTLSDIDVTPYDLTRCPDYTEVLGTTAATYQLNCARTRTIAPGGSVIFVVHLTLPADAQQGRLDLVWTLDDARSAQVSAAQTVLVSG